MKDSQEKPPLPNTVEWQPRETATETLQSAFLETCIAAEKLICLKSQIERNMNVDNFDSGIGLEDIVREEFRKLCPSRYSITSGVINDRDGKTGGDFDLIIFNELWFPQVKAGATAESRRAHFPIDGIYAVGEIKQTLDFQSLDSAMRKLVICHRLKRPRTFIGRTVENSNSGSCIHGLTNPLYSFILATDVRDGIELDELVDRFFDINKSLSRLEVVRALCVLDHGTVVWWYKDLTKREIKPAIFMRDDLYEPLIPSYFKLPAAESALYHLMANLFMHLFNSVLAPEDIAAHYGSHTNSILFPKSREVSLQPDTEWLHILNQYCDEKNEC